MLEVEHVSKKFKDHQVLVDVNLKVNQGDVVVILGPSGSGKTTFLRCLNHLEKADNRAPHPRWKRVRPLKTQQKRDSRNPPKDSLVFSITISSLTKQRLKIS